MLCWLLSTAALPREDVQGKEYEAYQSHSGPYGQNRYGLRSGDGNQRRSDHCQ